MPLVLEFDVPLPANAETDLILLFLFIEKRKEHVVTFAF